MIRKAFYRNMALWICLAVLTLTAGCDFARPSLIGENQHTAPPVLPSSTDSLEQMLKTQELSPAMQVRVLSKLFFETYGGDTLTAFAYIRQMKPLENVITDSLTMARLYNTLGVYYRQKDSLQNEIDMYDRVLQLFQGDSSLQAQEERAKALANKGLVFHRHDDYETAYSLYLEAENLFLNCKDYDALIQLYGRMAAIFLHNGNYERKRQILQKSSEIIDRVTDLDITVDYYVQQGMIYLHEEDYENSAVCWQKSLDILAQTQNQHQLHVVYYDMGLWAQNQELYDEAETYYRKSLSAAEKSGSKPDIYDGLLGVGTILYYREKFNEAEAYARKALDVALDIQSKLLLRNCYDVLAAVEEERNNFKKVLEYHALMIKYFRELVSAETQNKLNFMSVKYDLARKEASIRDLENRTAIQQYQVKLRGTLLASVSILIVILIVLIIIYGRYMKRKRQLAETRVRQLEQEKQLVATQAVLDGETAERTRLARDLHDGLGSMLSVVKLNLNDMKNGVIIESEDVTRFNRVVGLLDESIQELRRVAHNMMPDSLTRYGLRVSLGDFCNSIPGAVFSHYGGDERLDSKLEAMIYRTVHELVNNALKHAGAAEILVQMIQEYDRISITVQDDGCGFDPAAPASGAGLNNIRNRVGSYNGRMDVYSERGRGTEVSVEFKI